MDSHQAGRRGGRWERRDAVVGQSPRRIAALTSPSFWSLSTSRIFLRYSCSQQHTREIRDSSEALLCQKCFTNKLKNSQRVATSRGGEMEAEGERERERGTNQLLLLRLCLFVSLFLGLLLRDTQRVSYRERERGVVAAGEPTEAWKATGGHPILLAWLTHSQGDDHGLSGRRHRVFQGSVVEFSQCRVARTQLHG